MTIGQRIKEARKNAGLTQRELAEKSGTATGTIQQYELGKRQPRLEQLQRIASALGVKWWELVPVNNPGTILGQYVTGKAHLTITDKDGNIIYQDVWEPGEKMDDSEIRIISSFSKLNDDGQQRAAERIEELAEIPKYQRTATQNPPESTPPAREGKAPDTSQRPSEGK